MWTEGRLLRDRPPTREALSRIDTVANLIVIALGITAWLLPSRGSAAAVACLALFLAAIAPVIHKRQMFRYAEGVVAFQKAPLDWRYGLVRRWADKADLATAADMRKLAQQHAEIAQQHAEMQDRLREDVRQLLADVDGLTRLLDAAEIRAARSNRISFWGGVAVSIPIGVLINLVTG